MSAFHSSSFAFIFSTYTSRSLIMSSSFLITVIKTAIVTKCNKDVRNDQRRHRNSVGKLRREAGRNRSIQFEERGSSGRYSPGSGARGPTGVARSGIGARHGR